jgi:hypothetical protein
MVAGLNGVALARMLAREHTAIGDEARGAALQAGADLSADLAASLAAGQKSFRIQPGVYRLEKSLEIREVDGFTLDGTGATLVFGPGGGQLLLRNCRHSAVKGLTFDMDPLPFTQGTVLSVEPAAQTVEFKLDAGYPSLADRPTDQQMRFAFFDPDGARELPVIDTANPPVTVIAPGVYRASSPRFFSLAGRPLAAGDRVAIALKGQGGGISLRDCANILLEDVTIWAAGGFALRESGFSAGGNTYIRCRVVRRPGSGRLMAGASDGLHSITQRKGPVLRNCEIAHCFDDLVNVHGFFSFALERRDGKWLVACPAGQDFAAGSRLRFYRAPFAEPIGEATIKSCHREPVVAVEEVARLIHEHFRQAFRGLRLRNFLRTEVCEVELDRPVPLQAYDFVSCSDYSGAGAVIADSHFHDGHVRGILFKSSDSVVARCRFERIARSGLVVAPEIFWLEGPFPRNVRIVDNTFVDCGFGAVSTTEKSWEFAPLQVVSAFTSRLFPPLFSGAVNIHGVHCAGNRVVRAPGPGILIMNAADVRLEANRIEAPGLQTGVGATLDLTRNLPPAANPTAAERDVLQSPAYGILLMSTRDVRGQGNQVEGGRGLVGRGWGSAGVDVR